MQIEVSDQQLPGAFKFMAAAMIESLIEAAQMAATLKEMRADAAVKGIILPELDIPDLGDLCDRDSLPCRLAQQAMDGGILTGVEGFLAPTAV